MQANQFTIQIKENKPQVNPNLVALKKIEHFSYVMSEEIGLGFSSKVFKGKNDLTNELVAVKVIQLKNVEEVQFLNDEVIALERIKKANPVHLLKLEGVFKTKNNLYIITEFCEGKDLGKIIRKKKCFSQQQAQSILKQLLKGYKELYELQVVHRDLKLANIFVKNGQIKIADFGFAVAAETCDKKCEFNVGSPTYMSPEALKNNMYSYESDVWAIGIIAYELVHGRAPWKDRNDAVLYDMMSNTPIDNLFSQEYPISETYKNFIRKCLTVNIKQRASPEFIIEYEWKMASDFIEGMNRLDGGRSGTMSQIPHNHQIVRQVKSNNNIQVDKQRKQSKEIGPNQLVFRTQIFPERPDNSPSNVPINLLEKLGEQKAPDFPMPAAHGKIVSRVEGEVNKNEKQVNASLNRISSKDILSESQPGHKSLAFSDNIASKLRGFSSPVEHQIKPQTNEPKQSINQTASNKGLSACENAILSQIHYCRFLNMLFDEVTPNEPILPNYRDLQQKIAQMLLVKVNKLTLMAKNNQNVFELSCFGQYVTNSNWVKLRDTILQYHNKFNFKYGSYSNRFSTQDQSVEILQESKQTVRDAIKYLKFKIESHAKLAEMLINYYQVLIIQQKNLPQTFGTVSKIQFLVSKKLYEDINIERIMNRMEYLGL